MPTVSAADLLDLWQEESAKSLPERAIALLALAWPDTPKASLETLSIGQRDAMLMTLREQLFGSELSGIIICPKCRERLDLTFDLGDITSASQPAASAGPSEFSVVADGYDMRFRLLTTADAIAAAGEADIERSGRLIVQRCLLSAEHDGASIDSHDIPATVAEIVIQRLANADPLAEVQLSVICPCCTRRCSATLDISSFLWTELESWARRTLSDVHSLAAAYGWSEREILGLTPQRRQYYLEMAAG